MSEQPEQQQQSLFVPGQDINGNARSAYNNYALDEPEIVIPTAPAQPLPAFGNSPAPINGSFDNAPGVVPTAPAQVLPAFGDSTTPISNSVVNTSVVANEYKPTVAAVPPPSTTTTTTTTYIIPPSDNANYSGSNSAVAQRLARMKEHRKGRQALAATTGAVAGLILLGPLGAAVGGLAAHAAVKTSGRAAERRVRKKHNINRRGNSTIPTTTATLVGTTESTTTETETTTGNGQQVPIHRGHSVV